MNNHSRNSLPPKPTKKTTIDQTKMNENKVESPKISRLKKPDHHQPPIPKPTNGLLPNYMKPTKNHRASKQGPEVSAPTPVSVESKQNLKNPIVVASGQAKPPKTIARRPSIKPPRSSRKVKKDVEEHSSSSSVVKVCDYSGCALYAHVHPCTLNHPYLSRIYTIRTQKSFRVKGVTSSLPRRRGVQKIEKKNTQNSQEGDGGQEVSANIHADTQQSLGSTSTLETSRARPPKAITRRLSIKSSRYSKKVIPGDVSSRKTGTAASASGGHDKDEHTSSSKSKEVGIANEVEVRHDGSSVGDVRDYTGDNSTMLRHPFLSRGHSIRAQKSLRVKGVSSSLSRRRGVWKVEKKTNASQDLPLWAESSSVTSVSEEEVTGEVQNRRSGISNGVLPDKGGVGRDQFSNLDSEFSNAEMDIISAFLESIQYHGEAAFNKKNLQMAKKLSRKWLVDRNKKPREKSGNHAGETDRTSNKSSLVRVKKRALDQPIKHRGMAIQQGHQLGVVNDQDQSGSAKEQATSGHIKHASPGRGSYEMQSRRRGNALDDVTEYASSWPNTRSLFRSFRAGQADNVENKLDGNMEFQDLICEAEEYLAMDLQIPGEEEHLSADLQSSQVGEAYVPVDIQLLLDEYLPSHVENSDEVGNMASIRRDSEGTFETDAEFEARMSVKKNLIERCFEKLRTIRQVKVPDYLPADELQMEKIELRQMMLYDTKSAEEWMIDYRLRQLIAHLALARKRKVEILVEAYESVIAKKESM